ncbi:MAG: zinc-dependent alcohol dehydrogenase [Sphingomonadaceae bacterium]|nr:zinc-dependent alcohol dehydrogenase [Sphingomonadaceae bacterium]
MRALTWQGKNHVQVDNVPDPGLINPRDAIIKVTSTAICGSDLHLYDGVVPTLKSGDVLGHEFMGEVVEVGEGARHKLKKGDRVVVPFTIACGGCFFCERELWSCCDNSNTVEAQEIADALMGHSPSGLFGYTHMLGGFAGGQAEYVRVPFADVGPMVVPDGMEDEQVLFLTDIFPTGYMAAENCDIREGDTIAIWGCGPVGQFAIRSAFLLGAGRVIAIDHRPGRLAMAASAGAETLNFEEVDVLEALKDLSAGRGPDACIDAVGMEAHGLAVDNVYDRVKQAAGVTFDRPHVLRQAIVACRKGGTVSIPGVYGGLLDKIPFGAFVNKALTMKTGQTHVMRYLKPLLNHIQEGRIDPRFVISHTLPLEQAPLGYENFKNRQDEWTKVVLKPGMAAAA